MTLKVDLHGVNNFTPAEKEKFMRAVGLLETVLNSEEFKQEVLNYYYYKTVKTGWFRSKQVKVEGFKRNNGKTNAEIYEMIMSGKDEFNREKDQDIDVFTTMYYKNNSAIGYTTGNTWKTWINRKFYGEFDESDICGNILHEYAHNVGFGHAYRNNSTRKHTVPYALGYIAQKIAKRIAPIYGMK